MQLGVLARGKSVLLYSMLAQCMLFLSRRQEQRLNSVHLNRCFLKVGKKLQNRFWKKSVINKFAKTDFFRL